MHVVLKDLKDVLPERAAPVVADMISQLERGQEKCSKYEARSFADSFRGGVEGFLRAKNETVRFRYTHAFADMHTQTHYQTFLICY